MEDMNNNDEPTTLLGRLLAGVFVGGFAYAMFSIWSIWGLEGNDKAIVAGILGFAFFFIGNKFSDWLKNIFWWS